MKARSTPSGAGSVMSEVCQRGYCRGMPSSPDTKFAVLIDADNVQPSVADALLSEIAKYGVASVKRAYGDWTSDRLNDDG